MGSFEELLGNGKMAEEDTAAVGENNIGDSGLQDHIAHWVDVLDRWVTGIDTRLGRQDGGVPHREERQPSNGGLPASTEDDGL